MSTTRLDSSTGAHRDGVSVTHAQVTDAQIEAFDNADRRIPNLC